MPRDPSRFSTSGAITPGNRNMAAGGYDEGGNQRRLIVVIQKKLSYLDKKSVVMREPYMLYYVYVNGALPDDEYDNKGTLKKKYRKLESHVLVSEYIGGGLFKRQNELLFVGVNNGPINVIIPVTVPFADNERVDGSISIDLKCDLNHPEKLVRMLGTDYAISEVDGNETNKFVTAESLSYHIGNWLADAMLGISHNYDRTYDILGNIRNVLFDTLNDDMALSEYGLTVTRASIRFADTTNEIIRRLYRENEFEKEQDKLKHDKNMFELELSRKEYQEVHRGL